MAFEPSQFNLISPYLAEYVPDVTENPACDPPEFISYTLPEEETVPEVALKCNGPVIPAVPVPYLDSCINNSFAILIPLEVGFVEGATPMVAPLIEPTSYKLVWGTTCNNAKRNGVPVEAYGEDTISAIGVFEEEFEFDCCGEIITVDLSDEIKNAGCVISTGEVDITISTPVTNTSDFIDFSATPSSDLDLTFDWENCKLTLTGEIEIALNIGDSLSGTTWKTVTDCDGNTFDVLTRATPP